jgi:hypothetical protein
VDLPDVGRVTLATLDQLRQACRTDEAAAGDLSQQSKTLAATIEERLADAGAILVPQREHWAVPAELETSLRRADQLITHMSEIDSRRRDLVVRGQRSIFARLTAWRQDRGLLATRETARRELSSTLIHVARSALADGLGSPDAVPILDDVRRLDANLAQIGRLNEACSQRVTALKSEISAREDSERQMGFDALYTAAYFKRYGPQPVSSPLQLKAGEMALLSTPCTLSRVATRMQYVGGSSGFSFPIGHTGIRYRVGSFRGRRVEQEVLRQLDTGTLVVSNQRIAFIGHSKSVIVQPRKVTHVDIYNDALAVFQEGRETADFYLVSAPKQVAFYLNWVLQQG